MLEVKWIKTTHAVYAAIYEAHHAKLITYSTASLANFWLTEWGFILADAPLIKSEAVGWWSESDRMTGETEDPREWSYYIAQVNREEE